MVDSQPANVMPLSRYHKMNRTSLILAIGSSGGFDAPPPQTSGRLRSRRRLEEVEQSRGVEPAKAGSARLPVKLPRLPCDLGAGARALGQPKSRRKSFQARSTKKPA